MPNHDYTARQALELLLEKMKQFPLLYQRIKDAVDAGKDVQEEEPMGRRQVRTYRMNLPYTDQEAVGVAMTVLKSHLVETRKLISAANVEFAKVAVAPAKRLEASGDDDQDIARSRINGLDTQKVIELEVEPETVLEKRDLPNIPFNAATTRELEGLEAVFRRLRELTDFNDINNGHTL